MKVGHKKLGFVLGAVAAVALLPVRADAQFVSYSPVFFSFEGGGGLAIPLGDLDDVADPGPSVAVGASYFLNPHLALRVEGGVDFLDQGGSAPKDVDLQIWHYLAGLEYVFSDPTSSALFSVDFGAGGTTFDTDVFIVPDGSGGSTTGNFAQTYFALQGGLKLGYSFAHDSSTGVPVATIYVNGDIHVLFADEGDSALFTEFSGAGTSGFGTVTVIPITAGIRFNIP